MPIASNPSAGTYAFEQDLSIRATALPTSIGVVVGASKRGPINERTLVVDKEDFRTQFGKPDPNVSYMHYTANAFLQEANRLYVTRVVNDATLGGIIVDKAGPFATALAVNDIITDIMEYDLTTTNLLLITGANPGDWNNDLEVVLYPNVNDPEQEQFVITVLEKGVIKEEFKCTLRSKVDGNNKQLFVEDVVNDGSKLIRIRLNPINTELNNNPNAILMNALVSGALTGGSDGDPVTSSQIIQAWRLYEDPEDIVVNILINGGYTDPAVQLELDRIARIRDDAMAILDMPSDEQVAQDAVLYRRNTLNLNSSYSALYTPDVLIRDTDNGRSLYVPPSGFVAGVYARTDRVAAPYYAPAGLNRGILDVRGVRHVYKLGHRDMFADNQISVIQFMSGQGIVIWAEDTLQAFKSAFSNVSVRRSISMIKSTLRLATLPGVFEPNDELLQAEMRRICERLLEPIKQDRGLYNYEVVCDERNNKNATIANGDLIIDVYLDPTISAKRIHLNAIATRTGGIQFAIELLNAA
jgi:hypothetical protein